MREAEIIKSGQTWRVVFGFGTSDGGFRPSRVSTPRTYKSHEGAIKAARRWTALDDVPGDA